MNPGTFGTLLCASILPYLFALLVMVGGGHANYAIAVKAAKAMSHGKQTAYQSVWQPEALMDKRPVAIHLQRAGWK